MLNRFKATRTLHAETVRPWRGSWAFTAATAGWFALILQALLLFPVAVIGSYLRLRHPPADVRAQLEHAGLTPNLYALILTTETVIFAAVCLVVALLIVRGRPREPIALAASLFLILIGCTNSPEMQAVVDRHPRLTPPADLSTFALVVCLIGFFFVFPDGRIVPGWSVYPLLLGFAFGAVKLVTSDQSVAGNPPNWMGMLIMIGAFTGIAAQVYRYLRRADREQRQQTKWVVLGASTAILVTIAFSFGSWYPTVGRTETGYDLTSNSAVTLASLLLPISLGFAILKRRLWEIDVVVNRSLVYGMLTAGLLGVYLLIVEGLSALLQGRGRLPLQVLATALIAVLFAPVRSRLQTGVNRLMYGERDDPYRVLTRVGERAGAASAPHAALEAIAETIALAVKSPYVAISAGHTYAQTTSIANGREPAGALRLPLTFQGEIVGELRIAPRAAGEHFSPNDQQLLLDLAHQVGPAASAVNLTTDLQRSRERLVTAREEERRRLRRDLHDGLGPQLAALTLKIETIRNRFAADSALDEALVDLTGQVDLALSDIRRLVYGLRPPALDELGLLSALRQTAAQLSRSDGSLTLAVEAPPSLPPLSAAVEVAAFRIAHEALTNVVRHAEARTCRLTVGFDNASGSLRLTLADDGRGLAEGRRVGVGLVSMRERAEELGGRFAIASLPGSGTTVTVELPGQGSAQAHASEDDHGDDSNPHR